MVQIYGNIKVTKYLFFKINEFETWIYSAGENLGVLLKSLIEKVGNGNAFTSEHWRMGVFIPST